jgi:hypothetical protein
MNIKWKIEKKRGNFRALLIYRITLEDLEVKMALPAVSVTSMIPLLPDRYERFCRPDCNERRAGWQPEHFHKISSPDFRVRTLRKRLILPYTFNGKFEAVETSFARLREAFETELLSAYASGPIHMRKEMGMSQETGHRMAGGIAAQRMLKLVNT